jgi:hypothetical protein
VLVRDANGVILCVPIGQLRRRGGALTAVARVGSGRMSLGVQTREGGSIVLNARGLDLTGLDDPNVTVGVTLGEQCFLGSGNFRTRSTSKWVHP